jgi:hypothetical protein
VKRRIKVINKKGFEVATEYNQLYYSKDDHLSERVVSLKGYTYNLDNGNIVETKLGKENIFEETVDKNRKLHKFTMPAVKEGSVIDYAYTIESDYLFNLQPWNFQGSYPVTWTEYSVTIPDFLRYVTLMQGTYPFFVNSRTTKNSSYLVRDPNGTGAWTNY